MKGTIIVDSLMKELCRASFRVHGYSERISIQVHGETIAEAIGKIIPRLLDDNSSITILGIEYNETPFSEKETLW